MPSPPRSLPRAVGRRLVPVRNLGNLPAREGEHGPAQCVVQEHHFISMMSVHLGGALLITSAPCAATWDLKATGEVPVRERGETSTRQVEPSSRAG